MQGKLKIQKRGFLNLNLVGNSLEFSRNLILMSCLWVMTLLDNILRWLLTFYMNSVIFASAINSKDFKDVCNVWHEWMRLRRHSRFSTVFLWKEQPSIHFPEWKNFFKNSSKASKVETFCKWKYSENVLFTSIEARLAVLKYSRRFVLKIQLNAAVGGDRFPRLRLQTPLSLQMNSIKPYFPRIVYSNVPNRASFTFFSPDCLLACFQAIQSLRLFFFFKQAFGTFHDVNTPLSCFDQWKCIYVKRRT